jgi:hypothetical protein
LADGRFARRVHLGIVIPIAGVLAAWFGLARMIRIFRGTRDEPLPWHHRDR